MQLWKLWKSSNWGQKSWFQLFSWKLTCLLSWSWWQIVWGLQSPLFEGVIHPSVLTPWTFRSKGYCRCLRMSVKMQRWLNLLSHNVSIGLDELIVAIQWGTWHNDDVRCSLKRMPFQRFEMLLHYALLFHYFYTMYTLGKVTCINPELWTWMFDNDPTLVFNNVCRCI